MLTSCLWCGVRCATTASVTLRGARDVPFLMQITMLFVMLACWGVIVSFAVYSASEMLHELRTRRDRRSAAGKDRR